MASGVATVRAFWKRQEEEYFLCTVQPGSGSEAINVAGRWRHRAN